MNDAELEKRLERALQGMADTSGGEIPADIDERVLSIARTRASHIRQLRFQRVRTWAAAACFLLLAGFAVLLVRNQRPADVPPVLVAQRLDDPGSPDIVAAYLLACRLNEGRPVSGEDDANHDGEVDSRDVDTLAARAVAFQTSVAGGDA